MCKGYRIGFKGNACIFEKEHKGCDQFGSEGEERNEDAPQPSYNTKYKQAKKKTQASMTSFVDSAATKSATQNHKESKLMSSMLCKAPEEVVAERHKFSSS
jgi:hypothetical protein